MIVIIEGQRGTGKSTIAKKLNDVLEFHGVSSRIMKFTRGDNPHRDMRKQIIDMSLDPTSEIFIVDRFHLTEWVMRVVDGQPGEKLAIEATKIAKILHDVSAMTFILSCDKPIRKERLQKRNDGRGDEADDERVSAMWEFVSAAQVDEWPNVVAINTSSGLVDEIVANIAEKVENELEYITFGTQTKGIED